MSNALYLTAEERPIFDALSAELKEGWEVEEEQIIFVDGWEKRVARLSFVRLHDPALLKLKEKAQSGVSEQEIFTEIESTNLENATDDDLAELFFALGPNALTPFIAPLLHGIKQDSDLETLMEFTALRHSLLSALTHSH